MAVNVWCQIHTKSVVKRSIVDQAKNQLELANNMQVVQIKNVNIYFR